MPTPPKAGDTHVHERTFTREDVERFGELSGDTQPIHTDPDEDDRLVVQGLLTATLPTKIGGDLEVLATRMEYAFHRPVYTGDTVTCVWETESVTERPDRYELSVSLSCTKDEGETVMTGETDGLVWKDDDAR
jgi:acyl dehydratase